MVLKGTKKNIELICFFLDGVPKKRDASSVSEPFPFLELAMEFTSQLLDFEAEIQ